MSDPKKTRYAQATNDRNDTDRGSNEESSPVTALTSINTSPPAIISIAVDWRGEAERGARLE